MMDSIPVPGGQLQIPAYLSRPGGMNERIRDFDWSKSPIGEVSSWKQSLWSVLSICLNSNFPIAIYWGEELCLLYNDAWSPIPGNKHPWALGRPAKEVWPEIWKDIEPQFAKAFSGEPGGSKDALLPMQRHGYTEECYFDFTFTPVYGEEGKVDGIFNAVIETTYQIINDRRATLLQKISRKISDSVSTEEVFRKVTDILKSNATDIPFCYIYTLAEGKEPELAVATSDNKVKELPWKEMLKKDSFIHLRDISPCLDQIPLNVWPETPTEAMLLPLRSGNGVITGFLFAGLSARRKYDREYHLFFEQLSGAISSTLNTIRSMEEERNRAEALILSRKQLEESETALRMANEQLELTFKNVPAAIYLFNKDGKILYLNKEAANLNGLIPEEKGSEKKHLHSYHQEATDSFEIRDETGAILFMEDTPTAITLRTGKPEQKTMHFIPKNEKESKWILTSTSPLFDATGDLLMVLTTSTDITVQKKAEEKIRQSEEHFRNLTQALPQLVWVTDATGVQEFVNDRWKEYTGLDPYNEKTWAMIVHPDDIDALGKTWLFSMQSGNTYKAEARLKGRDGKYRWFHVQGEPIRSENNAIIKWVGAFTDIHDQKSAEELLRQSEEKLEFLVKKRTEQLERSNEDLQQFAHVASHDLKEPIRKIKIFSGLLEDEFNTEFNDVSKLYLTKIQSAADRMLLMMEGVLRYAALDGYEQGLEIVDLNEILLSVKTDLEMVIEKRQARVYWDTLPVVQGYPVLIYQLFYNLISNALKFSRSDISSVIHIGYNKIKKGDKDFAEIRIIDNGIGFEPGDAEKIFSTFARLNSREDYEGTGLGLSLCKKIALRHQGFLTAIGEPNRGAEFIVQLPFTHEDV